MAQDVLTDVFQTMRVSGAEYSRFEATAPWVIDVRATQVVRFYAVLAGECQLTREGALPLRLAPGDLVVLPRSTVHTLSSGGPAKIAYPESALDARGLGGEWPRSFDSEVSGGGDRYCIVSGRFSFDTAQEQQWWPLLPEVIAVRGRAHTLPWLESTLHFIASESGSPRPGTRTLVTRLSDLLVFQVIREYLASLSTAGAEGPSWLAALSEPQIGAAMAAIHESPEQAWTVRCLARKVGMSRSAFAARFARLVGEPPLHYLTRVRMQKAAALLRDSWAATAEVADQVGYVSDTAFCKAFKRAYGQSPGAYRRMAKAAPHVEAA